MMQAPIPPERRLAELLDRVREGGMALVLLGIVLALAIFFFIQRERIYNFLVRLSKPGRKKA